MQSPLIIVIGLGSAGDVHPNIGLALTLRKMGAGVLFAGPEVFRSLAWRTGLDFIGLLGEEEYEAALRDPDLWHPYRSFSVVANRLILPALKPVYEVIEQHFKPERTVVAAPGLAFAARVAQEKLGVPLATIHLQPVMLRSTITPVCFGFPHIISHLPRPLRSLYLRAADRFIIDQALARPLNFFRSKLGLAPVHRLFDRWVHSPQLVIGLFPDWFAPPQPDWPPNVYLTGFPVWDEGEIREHSEELEAFLQSGEPPLVFTAGSAMRHAKQFFEVSAQVCSAMGRRGLFLTQFKEQLPAELPCGVRHFDYIPFSKVLPRSAALVHHGGIGTTAQAIAAGVPQLIVPNTHDQPDNAIRVRTLGIGDYVLPKVYDTKRVARTLLSLLDSDAREKSRRFANLTATGSLENASRLILELVARRA